MLYITYVCPNEGMTLGDDDANLLFICRNTTQARKLHYYTLFLDLNISIIFLQITPLFLALHNFSFGWAVSNLERLFSFPEGWKVLHMGLLISQIHISSITEGAVSF